MRPLSSATLGSLIALLVAPVVRADTIVAPIGGRSLRLPGERVFCDTAVGSAGWTIDPDGHTARPPSVDTAIGTVTSARVALTSAQCANTTSTVSLVATAPLARVSRSGTSARTSDRRRSRKV